MLQGFKNRCCFEIFVCLAHVLSSGIDHIQIQGTSRDMLKHIQELLIFSTSDNPARWCAGGDDTPWGWWWWSTAGLPAQTNLLWVCSYPLYSAKGTSQCHVHAQTLHTSATPQKPLAKSEACPSSQKTGDFWDVTNMCKVLTCTQYLRNLQPNEKRSDELASCIGLHESVWWHCVVLC